MKEDIDKLEYLIKIGDISQIIEILKKLVTGFEPSDKIYNNN